MTQQETTAPKGQKEKNTVLVRYGKMGGLGWFTHKEKQILKTATRVVIKTERGLELGDIVGVHCYKGGHFRCGRKELENYYESRSRDYPLTTGGTLVRYATKDDLMEERHLEVSAKEELKCCQRYADEMELPMKIVESEHVFGGERIIMYFTSAGRVDFRDLVKKLAREYQTRIELRQIGARDEARLISDYESCGQECCCRRFLKILSPVNMRMAKIQKATLDPSKISGHCGRLKCCLRYEDETYKELKANLPRKNVWLETKNGIGRVVDSQIMTQLVVVEYQTGKREAVPVAETKPADKPEVRPLEKPRERRPARENSKPAVVPEKPAAVVEETSEVVAEKPTEVKQPAADDDKTENGPAPKPKKKKRRRRGKKWRDSQKKTETNDNDDNKATEEK
ncbi:MAG TPA: signal peptidase [Phycisphaerales bacterium]|nr:signal peptidase [Phycisphaerales bacterium]